jgi:hypothetical protein
VITESLVKARIKAGWSEEEARLIPRRPKRKWGEPKPTPEAKPPKKQKPTTSCLQCKTKFYPKKRRNAKFCTKSCYLVYSHEQFVERAGGLFRTCLECSGQFKVTSQKITQKFCRLACYLKYRHENPHLFGCAS